LLKITIYGKITSIFCIFLKTLYISVICGVSFIKIYMTGNCCVADGYGDSSTSKCNGLLLREKELEPWVGDGAANEDSLEAIEDSVVDGLNKHEVVH